MTNSKPLITIDTDNAVIRLYVLRSHEAGLSESAIARLRLDAEAIATAVSAVSGAEFRVRSEVAPDREQPIITLPDGTHAQSTERPGDRNEI